MCGDNREDLRLLGHNNGDVVAFRHTNDGSQPAEMELRHMFLLNKEMNRESGEQLGAEETHYWCHHGLNFLRNWKWDELLTFSASVASPSVYV
jgi:hypothetical protein